MSVGLTLDRVAPSHRISKITREANRGRIRCGCRVGLAVGYTWNRATIWIKRLKVT